MVQANSSTRFKRWRFNDRRHRQGEMDDRLPRCGRRSVLLTVVVVFLLTMVSCAPHGALPLEESLAQVQERRQQSRRLYREALDTDDPQRQVSLLTRAVALDDLHGEAHHNLGVAYFELEQLHQAATQLQRAADLMPASALPKAHLAILHASFEQWDRALTLAYSAYETDPLNTQARRVLARALQETRAKPQELERVLEQLAMRDPAAEWRDWATGQKLQLAPPSSHRAQRGAVSP